MEAWYEYLEALADSLETKNPDGSATLRNFINNMKSIVEFNKDHSFPSGMNLWQRIIMGITIAAFMSVK